MVTRSATKNVHSEGRTVFKRARPAPDMGKVEGSAGQSARSEYRRRRSARQARLRKRFGRLAPAAALIGGEAASERSWRRGAEGEERTAGRLAKHLRERGVIVLQDRRIPGRRANIDHLAVGPGGITVIDTKNYTGKVAVRGGRLWVNGRDRTKLIHGVLGQIEVIRSALAASTYAGAPIEAALAWSNGEALPLLGSLRLEGVLIDGTRKAAKLASRPGPLSVVEVDQLAALLGDQLPPA
jgi:hypothetical protein